MTIDDRVLIDVADLAAVRFECGACGTAVTFPTSTWETIPPRCPGCGVEWHVGTNMAPYESLNRLRVGLKAVVAVAPQVGYRVRFELREKDRGLRGPTVSAG